MEKGRITNRDCAVVARFYLAPHQNLSGKLRKFLLKPGALACAFTQVVELSATYLGSAFDDDPLKAWRAAQESAFYPDTIAGDTSDGEILIVATASFSYYGTFEFLDALIGTFFNSQVDFYIVSRTDFRDIRIDRCFYGFQ
jgi:hypothetical protein